MELKNPQRRSTKAITRQESRLHRRLWPLVMAFSFFLAAQPKVGGQEALRQSLAGEATAEAQKDASSAIGYYNLLLGDVALRFIAGAGVQYDDNVHLQNDHPQGDVIFTPNVNTQIHAPITQNNSLDISIGAGYSAYVKNPDLDEFYVNPGSGIRFNIYVGDFAINLHDYLTVTENGYQNPGANGNGNNATLENTVGTGATWDLDQLVTAAGYDHVNYVSLGSNQSSQPDASSENLYWNGGVRVRPEITTGLEAGGSLVDYDQSSSAPSPNSKQWNVGAFGRLQISEYLSAELHGGYTELLPESTTTTNFNTGDTTGYYFDFSLTHRVNQYINYSLTAGRSTDLQTFGQPYTYYYVRLTPNWNLFRKYQISTPFFWEQGTQIFVQANNANDYDQYGAGISIARQITEKLTGTLSYQFVQETSSQANLNYIVNTIGLNLSYQF